MTHQRTFAAVLAGGIVASGMALAQAQCDEIAFSDVGWTDITATTAIANEIFTALGYDVNVDVLSVPVTFASLASGDTDVFLGNWMPTQAGAIQPYLDEGTIETVNENLTGTIYNLAVPVYTYDAGLKTYDDLAAFADDLDGTIYGIEPGNLGNAYLIGLTEKDAHGMGAFKVRESSEQGMLGEVRRAVSRNEPIVFLGWAPHPMNANFDIEYLEGGKDFFGGEGVVNTVTRAGFSDDCPNAARLLEQLDFTLDMENTIMGSITDDGMMPAAAARQWLAANPGVLDGWLDGVTTADGGPGLDAVRQALGI
ncbi:glycine betaine ABC transporter substrate-binding protein [Oceaniovalibus guishaninsula JLT2003]|uniref:Glycine betaine ABC transporter substrate-binding protein n=1 Tax=Oceaniovalibus guishaninsula JLT2003 TaxID=1231392 RepID=K2HAT9_9RHOB|nr:choline ABC transporter substrate-binding protein [Oceaniovalibus guishaninsula]EKE44618.1 glycine betaine ABC transporter substrate-binding protein [Oceaniovalibus guishaninsula JLT2003]